MRILITIFILFGVGFCPYASGQNLIPNYSFEDTVPIPPGTPYYYHIATDWTTANQGSPDYFSPKNKEIGVPGGFFSNGMPLNVVGYQYPKTGIAYMGLVLNGYATNPDVLREYLQARLKQTLKKDSIYCLQFYISLADSCQLASRNQLGIYFSNNAISSNNPEVLNYSPQIIVSPMTYITDKVNWIEYNFQYTAQGGERFITLGNFRPYSFVDTLPLQNGGKELYFKRSYYYIDNVWLSHCDSIPLKKDLSINSLFNETACYTKNTGFNLSLKNKGVDSLDFTKDTLVISAEVLGNGNVIQSFQQEISNNSFNHNGHLLGQDSSISFPLNPINLSIIGQSYQLKIVARLKADEDTTNNFLDTVIVNNLSLGSISSSDSLICFGTSVALKSENSKGDPQWQYSINQIDWLPLNESTVATHQPIETTYYRFSICDYYYSEPLKVEVNDPPVLKDTSVGFCRNTTETIVPHFPEYISALNWYSSQTATVPFFQGFAYSFKVKNNQTFYIETEVDSCVAQERSKIEVLVEPCALIIPNIFTPNGDGNNDTWELGNTNGLPLDITIYNVWGMKVAHWKNNPSWDGNNCATAVYFYIITHDGETYKGTLSLLR
ncbi:T9SS type B sorting domain-containing protein [Acidiluteibacter ferrifornacis]|uniref:T9SS type B sorting domain-containing protein n=1 Tax=Acidiluteibacter ferrifornacis TaxID=2692424 RepID=A0A6N9NJ34_9FLAO|nr:gliding motility-associated C-terminal domain-containing protein [Acidiluteibacter ferrifornacis]NBG65862.1 T9SS type B sorting domain-containing protein [Acidiluteibacter ferrifornacis]